MSRKLISNTVAALCTVALLFAVAVGVDAQSDDPLFEDDVICSIQQGRDLWVAPESLRPALEAHLGQTATVEPMSSLLGRIPSATKANSVRFEGGFPGPNVSLCLDALGYTTSTDVSSEIAGANSAVSRTI